ncbi:I78 family peptidase inhibitor [Arenimonas caeni]|jgi:hypothetical protein|nr:I78 family peptidase inhibitor [Arenimonas caeni]MDY0022109.1 I78 family peptidase inhibitor [Arenimonas caeni]
MSLLRPASLVLASLFALAACATPPSESTPAGEDPAFAPAPPPPAMVDEGIREDPPVICNQEAGQWAVGQVADEALVEKVRTDTQSQRVRVIKPGMMVTMDHREDRVNIEVDDENRVTVVRCG